MDDVIAVMDAAGSRARGDRRHARGRPDGRAVRRHPPRPRQRAGPLRDLRARHLGARTTSGPGAPRSATARMDELVDHWGEGWVAGGVAPSRMGEPGVHGVGRPARAARRQPGDDQAHLRPDRRVRRARRAALDPRADARAAPPRGQLHQDRALALPGRAHPGRASSSSSRAATTCSRSATARPLLGEIEEFLTGERHDREPDRMLATVLFTDICGSTEHAAQMGDRSWRFMLERHDALFRRALERHRGREVKRTGDGFLATFDGPGAGDPLRRRRGRRRRLDRPAGARRPAHRRAGGDGRRPGRPGGAHRRPRDGPAPSPARCSCRAP